MTSLKTWAPQGMRSVAVSMILAGIFSGCENLPFRKGDASAEPQRMALPEGMTAEELVAHINRNTSKVHAWRSNQVEIRAKGLPVDLKATVAVEHPRNFRLIASSLMGNVADLGSNQERFWVWMRAGIGKQPEEYRHVFTVQHQHMPDVLHAYQAPMQPDWLLEAMGVVPLKVSQARVEASSQGSPFYRLVVDAPAPDGRTMRRLIEIEKRTGHVLSQSLYGPNDQLMARAVLRKYRYDQQNDVSMPHEIELDWPSAQMSMTMVINQMQINPPHLPSDLWMMPAIRDCPPLDIGVQLAQNRPPMREPVPLPPPGRELREAIPVPEKYTERQPDWEPLGSNQGTGTAPPFPDFIMQK